MRDLESSVARSLLFEIRGMWLLVVLDKNERSRETAHLGFLRRQRNATGTLR
jgi:hypothetical protein